MKIFCPSYKRAGLCKSFDIFGVDLVFAVHEFESESYNQSYPDNELLILPDAYRGNMAKVRNFILENAGSELVMIDDDLTAISFFEDQEKTKMSKADIYRLIENGFQMAYDLKTLLWGINITPDPQAYRQYSPFSFLSPILKPFSCIINSDLRYDERLGLNEDYDYFMQVVYLCHKSLRFNKYCYDADHIDLDNGCASYRTLQREKEQAIIMTKKWGSKAVKYDFSRSTNPTINIPLKGI